MTDQPIPPVDPPNPPARTAPPLDEEEPDVTVVGGVRTAPPLDEEEPDATRVGQINTAPPVNEGDAVEVTKLETVEERRENIRGLLAAVLVGILAVAFMGGLLLVASGNLNVTEVKALSPLVMSPLVTLVGTVLGFYFGGQTARDQNVTKRSPGKK